MITTSDMECLYEGADVTLYPKPNHRFSKQRVMATYSNRSFIADDEGREFSESEVCRIFNKLKIAR
jgi:hypothetical protein